jgi:hypothetical protein
MIRLTIKQAQALRFLAQDTATLATKWLDPHGQDAGHALLADQHDFSVAKVPGATITALHKAGLIAPEQFKAYGGYSSYNHTWRITDAGRAALAEYVEPQPVQPQLTRFWQTEHNSTTGRYSTTWIDCRRTAKGWIAEDSQDGYDIGRRYEENEVHATPRAALEYWAKLCRRSAQRLHEQAQWYEARLTEVETALSELALDENREAHHAG